MTELPTPQQEKDPIKELEEARAEVITSVNSLVDDVLDNPSQFDMSQIGDEEIHSITTDGSRESVAYRTKDGSYVRAHRLKGTVPEALDPSRIFTDRFIAVGLAESGDSVEVGISELLKGITSAVYGDSVSKKRDSAAQDSAESLDAIKTVVELFRGSASVSL